MEIHIKFYTFNIEYILCTYPSPKPKQSTKKLELEKQLSFYPLLWPASTPSSSPYILALPLCCIIRVIFMSNFCAQLIMARFLLLQKAGQSQGISLNISGNVLPSEQTNSSQPKVRHHTRATPRLVTSAQRGDITAALCIQQSRCKLKSRRHLCFHEWQTSVHR